MQEEQVLKYNADDFIKNYLPFVPSNTAIKAVCEHIMLSRQFYQVRNGMSANSAKTKQKISGSNVKTLHLRAPTATSNASRSKRKTSKPPPRGNVALATPKRVTEYFRSLLSAKGNAFVALNLIADAVESCGKICDGRTRNEFRYTSCPNSRMVSPIKGLDNEIDACFMSGDDELHATNIAVPITQKLDMEDRYLNNREIFSANVQIMNDDVRRMFTFGVTIENEEATLWYHCRSYSAISMPFNFVENPRLFIKVFLSFLFSTPKELGYDPDISLVDRTTRQYTFRIFDADGEAYRLYRTVRVISEYRSNNITGRMARVWLVDHIDSKGNELGLQSVLKDVWLEKTAATEKQIQQNIFADIQKFCHPDSTHFLLALKPLEASHAEALNNIKTRNAEIVKSGAYKDYFLHIEQDFAGECSKEVALPAVNSTSSIKSIHEPPRNYIPRRQYRVVFKEVCRAVGHLRHLGEVVDVLQQTLIPLSLMYCAGWVHRDISAGNILAHSKDKTLQAKLSDLEYAKKFLSPSPGGRDDADPKTGTPFFMPIEIMQRTHLYYNFNITRGSRLQYDLIKQYRQKVESSNKKNKKPSLAANKRPSLGFDIPVVTYNFQHDLESLWWLLVWFITVRVDHEPSTTWADTVYVHSDLPTFARTQFLRRDDPRARKDPLSEVLLPSLMPALLDAVEYLRESLVVHYAERSTQYKLTDEESYARVHEEFHLMFYVLRNRPESSWKDTPLLGSKPDLAQDTAKSNTTVPLAQTQVCARKPARKRLRSDACKSGQSEDYADQDPDEDGETSMRRASKRQKASTSSRSFNSTSISQSRSRAKTTSTPKTRSKSKGAMS